MPQTLRCLSRFQDRGLGGAGREMRFLAGFDVVAFLGRELRMVFRRVVEAEPQRHPHQRQAAGDHERQAPAVEQDGPGHQRRRQHRTERRADVVEAAGESALLRRKPFGDRLHAARLRRAFGETHEAAQPRQDLPVGGDAVKHGDQRPRDREQPEAELQADEIHHVAGERLQHDAELEDAGDPGIFLLADAELTRERGSGDAERRPREVVEDRADRDQADHPPAQCV